MKQFDGQEFSGCKDVYYSSEAHVIFIKQLQILNSQAIYNNLACPDMKTAMLVAEHLLGPN